MKHFVSNCYPIYIQHCKTVFFDTIRSHIEIIHEKWVAWMKGKLHFKS